MAYYAAQRLLIGGSYREIGEEVPEAKTWDDIRPYLDGGQLVERDAPFSAPGAGTEPADPVGTAPTDPLPRGPGLLSVAPDARTEPADPFARIVLPGRE